MSEDNKSANQDMERVNKLVAELSEHFDTVHVFCTRHESDDIGTVRLSRGSGNWFARFGQIQEWVIREIEGARIATRKDSEDD